MIEIMFISAQCYEQFTAAKCRNVIKHFYGRISHQQSHLAAKIHAQIYVAACGVWRTEYGVQHVVVVTAVAAFITSTAAGQWLAPARAEGFIFSEIAFVWTLAPRILNSFELW